MSTKLERNLTRNRQQKKQQDEHGFFSPQQNELYNKVKKENKSVNTTRHEKNHKRK